MSRTIHWGWTALTVLLTALLLGASWIVGTWAAFGSGFVDEVIVGLLLIVIASVAANLSWIPVLAINGIMIWLLSKSAPESGMTDGLQALVILVAINLLLQATFYTRRRVVS